MPDLISVTPDGLPKVWPLLRERVQYGIDKSRGHATLEGLYEAAKSGEYDCHFVYQDEDEAKGAPHGPERVLAVLFVQVYDDQDGSRACAMRFLTGKNRTEWTWLCMALETWAVQNGCDRMEMLVRRGWVKELREWDYRASHTLVEKTLKPKAEGHGLIRQENHDHDHAHAAGG